MNTKTLRTASPVKKITACKPSTKNSRLGRRFVFAHLKDTLFYLSAINGICAACNGQIYIKSILDTLKIVLS